MWRIVVVFLAVVLSMGVESARGAVSGGNEVSVEARVVGAEVVVRGRVKGAVAETKAGWRAGSLEAWERVTLEVLEVYKGLVGREVVVEFQVAAGARGWWDGVDGGEAVFFIEPGTKYPWRPAAYRAVRYTLSPWSAPVELPREGDLLGEELVGQDLKPVKTRRELLARVWRAAQQMGGEEVSLNRGMGPSVEVPVTTDMLEIARGWGRSARTDQRWWAARVLARVETREDAVVLGEIARDVRGREENPSEVYFARAVALSALERWGKDVRGVEFRAHEPVVDWGRGSWWLGLVGGMVLPVLYVRRTLRGGVRVRWGIAALLLVFSAYGASVVGSFFRPWGMTWGDEAVVLSEGNGYWIRAWRSDVTVRRPVVFCRAEEVVGFEGRWWAQGWEAWFHHVGTTSEGGWGFDPDEPYWREVEMYRVPVWVGLVGIGGGWGIGLGVRWWRRVAARRGEVRGFPVEGSRSAA
jgi:hypothetical protein